MVAIDWLPHSSNNYISGLQLTLSNGQKSPAFLANDQQANFTKRVELNFPVKKIKGNPNTHDMSSVSFHSVEDVNVAKMFIKDNGGTVDKDLNDGEVIIGVYGIRNNAAYIRSLGFIVYKPAQ